MKEIKIEEKNYKEIETELNKLLETNELIFVVQDWSKYISEDIIANYVFTSTKKLKEKLDEIRKENERVFPGCSEHNIAVVIEYNDLTHKSNEHYINLNDYFNYVTYKDFNDHPFSIVTDTRARTMHILNTNTVVFC